MVALDDCINRVKYLAPAPALLPELLNCLSDTNVDSSRIVRLISFDPALTTSVLQLCNSPFFASASRVGDLDEAILRLGLEQVYRLIAVVSVAQSIRSRDKNNRAEGNQLWKHSVATAVASKLIAQDLHIDRNLVFTAALLHDIGKLILAEAFEEVYLKITEEVKINQLALLEAEKRVLGVDHAEVGGRLLARWRFPANLTMTVCFHHQPEAAELHQRSAACVHVGDAIAYMMGSGSGNATAAMQVSGATLESLGLASQCLPDYVERAKDEFIAIQSLFQISA